MTPLAHRRFGFVQQHRQALIGKALALEPEHGVGIDLSEVDRLESLLINNPEFQEIADADYRRWFWMREHHDNISKRDRIARSEAKLTVEFERAENLLRNILPDQIAVRLKDGVAIVQTFIFVDFNKANTNVDIVLLC